MGHLPDCRGNGEIPQQINSLNWSQERQLEARGFSHMCCTHAADLRNNSSRFSTTWTLVSLLTSHLSGLHIYCVFISIERAKEVNPRKCIYRAHSRWLIWQDKLHKDAAWSVGKPCLTVSASCRQGGGQDFSPIGNKESHPAPLKWEPALRGIY